MSINISNFNQNTIKPINNQDETPKANGSFKLPFNVGKANRKIDDDFAQGNIGDCALLSSVYSLSLTEEGSKAIKDAIKINKNWYFKVESYDVHFTGVDETYHITPEELKEAKEMGNDNRVYSWGDDDMTLLELAMEKCFEESKDATLRGLVDNYTDDNLIDKLNGVNPAAVTYLLTGELSENIGKQYEKLSRSFVACSSYNMKDIEGNERYFEEGQEYTLKSATTQYVYMENQFDTDEKEIVFDTDEFTSDIFIRNNEEALSKSEELLDNFEKNNGNSMIVFATTDMETVKDVNGEEVELSGPHAYSVAAVEDDFVILINPHNTSKELKIPQKNLLFLESFQFFSLDFDKNKSNL